MYAEHIFLLYHTEVRWLSKGNDFQCVLDHKKEMNEFLNLQKRAYWHDLFKIASVFLTFATFVTSLKDSML